MKARRAKIFQNWIYTIISLVSVSTVVAAYFVTRDNFNLMREDIEMRNRPILSLDAWDLEIDQARSGDDVCRFTWETRNYGQTPATNVSLELQFYSINDNELYSRNIYRNKYIVPGKSITQESENIDPKFELPREAKLYLRFENERLHMKIKLKYNDLRERKRLYVYEISGYFGEGGWKTASESRDEISVPGKIIYIGFPEEGWIKYAWQVAADTALLEGHKLHSFLINRVAGFFSGNKIYALGQEFALAVKDVDEELKRNHRLSFAMSKDNKKKKA